MVNLVGILKNLDEYSMKLDRKAEIELNYGDEVGDGRSEAFTECMEEIIEIIEKYEDD